MISKFLKFFGLVLIILILIFFIILVDSATTKSQPQDQIIERFERKTSLMEIHFIDVGYGEATLIITPENQKILIDGGGDNKLGKYLEDKNINKIDLLIVTNPTKPYISGLPELFDRIQIEKVIDSGYCIPTNINRKYLSAIKKADISSYFIGRKSMELRFKELKIKLLSPKLNAFSKNIDPRENSLVTLFLYENISFLHTGAVGEKSESFLVNDEDIYDKIKNVDILKVSRMGSKHANSQNFIATTNPDIAVINVGDNPRNLPDPEVIKMLKKVNIHRERVDQQGSMVFYTDGNKIKWEQ